MQDQQVSFKGNAEMNTIVLLIALWFSSPPDDLSEGYFKEGWAPREQSSMMECNGRRLQAEEYFRSNTDILGDEGVLVVCLTVTEDMYKFLIDKYEKDANIPQGDPV